MVAVSKYYSIVSPPNQSADVQGSNKAAMPSSTVLHSVRDNVNSTTGQIFTTIPPPSWATPALEMAI